MIMFVAGYFFFVTFIWCVLRVGAKKPLIKKDKK